MGKKFRGRGNSFKSRKETSAQYLEGKICITSSGFGFVMPDEGGEEIFIPAKRVNGAIDGDRVKIRLLDEPPRPPYKMPPGSVEKIIERGRKIIVGELIAGRKVRPLARSLPFDMDVSGSLKNAKRGDWIECELGDDDRSSGARFKEIIGHVGDIRSDLEAVAREYSLQPPYTQHEEDAALQIPPVEIKREDLTGLFVATIDPPDAKDFDDAISLSPGKHPGEVVLGVHIADIAPWIVPGSELDRKAYSRSFTSYLPGMTLPMLPRTFTRMASLVEGRESLAHTMMITINTRNGKVLKSRRFHSRIFVRNRLTFDQVQSFIDGMTPLDWSDELCKNISALVSLTRKMREFRKNSEDFLQLSTSHVRILVDESTKQVTGIRRESQGESDMLVEECMLAANVEAAKELSSRGIPGLYRVHAEPSPEKLEEFTSFMRETFRIVPGDLTSRKAANKFLASIPDDHRKQIIMDAFLRSMPRACYMSKPAIHFGLGKGLYSHFTSPIRRYSDLIVHQQLLAVDLNHKKSLRQPDVIAKFATSCSEKEQNNDEAYYAANDRMKLHYLKKILTEGTNETFEGIVQKVISAGLSVHIPDIGIGGIVPMENLRGNFRKGRGRLDASLGKASFKCGDYIYVTLDRMDFVRGTVFLRPVN